MQQQPIEPRTPLSVTLTAETWNVVISVLRKGPYELVADPINAILGQCQSSAVQPTDE